MSTFAEQAGQALKGSFELLQRRAEGLSRFDVSESGFWRSFAAIPLAIPAFVVLVAFYRAEDGLLQPGASLFADPGPLARAALDFASIWAAPLLVAFWVARLLELRQRFVALVVALNWTGVIAAGFIALPGLLFALGLATAAHAWVYGTAFLILVLHLQWFTTKHALGVSSGVAAAIVMGQAAVASFARALV
jgi:hypothetical protein